MAGEVGGIGTDGGPQQKEIYTFKAPWTIYSLAWSNWYATFLFVINKRACLF
jgi:hypothetical protein